MPVRCRVVPVRVSTTIAPPTNTAASKWPTCSITARLSVWFRPVAKQTT